MPRDDDEPLTPPKGDAVPADEIQKVITWINEAHGPGLEHIKRVATKAADERRLDRLGVLEPTEGEQVLIDGAVAALRDRGAVVQAVAQRHYGLEVNLSLLRPAANDEHLKALMAWSQCWFGWICLAPRSPMRASPNWPDSQNFAICGWGERNSTTFPESFRDPKLERLNLYGTMHQYNFDLRGRI